MILRIKNLIYWIYFIWNSKYHLKLSINLLKKINAKFYLKEYEEYFKDDVDSYEHYVVKHYSTYRKVIKIYNCKNSKEIAIQMAQYNHNKAIRLLFKILENN